MNFRSNYSSTNHRGCVYRVCFTMGSNILLRSHSNYKNTNSNSLHRKGNNPMTMRKLFSLTTNTKSVLLHSLLTTPYNYGNNYNSFNHTPQNRIFQPNRTRSTKGQNKILSLFRSKRYIYSHKNNYNTNNINTINTKHIRRRRKLQHSQNNNNTSSHSTRMIFSFCLCYPTFNSL